VSGISRLVMIIILIIAVLGGLTAFVIVNWLSTVRHYTVTFAQTGLDATATGVVVTINGTAKNYSELPYSIEVSKGDTLFYVFSNFVSSSAVDKRFDLLNVTGSVSSITITNTQTITGNYLLKSAVWLVGLSTSGLKMMASNDLTFMTSEFLEEIPVAYKYSFVVDGNNLYVGLTYNGSQIYRVDLKTGTVDTLTVSSTGDLRDLKVTGRSLYALVMDYSSGTSLLVQISLDTFTVLQRFHLEAFVKGTPYKLQLVSNAAYVVAYNSTSSTSWIAYISLPNMTNYFSVQLPWFVATRLDMDGNKLYVRGSDEVAVFSCNPQLTFIKKISNLFGYGDLLYTNGKLYVAGSTLSWRPAVYVITTETMTVEQTFLLSTSSGAALNLAVKDSTIYALFFSSGEGCSLGTIESGSAKFLIPNTENEFPTSLFYVEW